MKDTDDEDSFLKGNDSSYQISGDDSSEDSEEDTKQGNDQDLLKKKTTKYKLKN